MVSQASELREHWILMIFQDELSRLNQRELILQRKLAVEGKKMKVSVSSEEVNSFIYVLLRSKSK